MTQTKDTTNIEDTIKELKKEFPSLKTVVDELGSDVKHVYPFGCPAIDIPYGGGIYSGKVYQNAGWESVGKSTLGLEMARAFCNYWKARKENNYVVVWMEAES
ncbi:unnamed protein product, partial [marine sediment metagenome]